MANYCPQCGQGSSKPDSQFCGSCGVSLSLPLSSTSQALPKPQSCTSSSRHLISRWAILGLGGIVMMGMVFSVTKSHIFTHRQLQYAEDAEDFNSIGIRTPVAPFGSTFPEASGADQMAEYRGEAGTTSTLCFYGNHKFAWISNDSDGISFGTWTLDIDHVDIHLARGAKSTAYHSVPGDYELMISKSGNVVATKNGRHGWRRRLQDPSQPSAVAPIQPSSNSETPMPRDPGTAIPPDPASALRGDYL